jgi:enamine deaminase RidA (YjgF/YER057c/UK114 family)
MKVKKITINPDPYEPFRLAQGYRVGELLFISGQTARDGSGQVVEVTSLCSPEALLEIEAIAVADEAVERM